MSRERRESRMQKSWPMQCETLDTQHSIDDWSRHMERLNTQTLLGHKQTVNREDKQGEEHRKRNEQTQSRCCCRHTNRTEIIKIADKIRSSTRNVRKRKASWNYLSVLEEIASINSMNSEFTKNQNQTESEIVTNTGTLERKNRAARKDREWRKESLETQESLSLVSVINIKE